GHRHRGEPMTELNPGDPIGVIRPLAARMLPAVPGASGPRRGGSRGRADRGSTSPRGNRPRPGKCAGRIMQSGATPLGSLACRRGGVLGMVPGGLLEREGELARIDRRLAAARAGRGGVLVITGPAGIGKTALLTEAGERAGQAGMRVLAGRGGELEGGF